MTEISQSTLRAMARVGQLDAGGECHPNPEDEMTPTDDRLDRVARAICVRRGRNGTDCPRFIGCIHTDDSCRALAEAAIKAMERTP